MISSKSRQVLKIFLAVLMFTAVTSICFAQDEPEEEGPDLSAQATEMDDVKTSIAQSQQNLSNSFQLIFDHLIRVIKDQTTAEKNTLILMEKERLASEQGIMTNFMSLSNIAQERAKSGILTDETRKALDQVNYQVLEGYKVVPGVGHFGQDNPAVSDNLAYMGKIYALHVKLFCNPAGMTNPPPGCGSDRQLAGITGDENFVDFFLSDRSWPKAVSYDAMQVARSYFFSIKPRFSAKTVEKTPVNMVKWQREAAIQSTRMAMLNALAARRAPVSTATGDVLRVMTQGFAATSNISSTDYTTLCAKAETARTQLESYVCSYTNVPDPNQTGATPARQISQAAIDRIMQYDYYMSPLFYSAINSPGATDAAGLERMEVLMLAQQLTQDYYFLRMLQMKTVATALNSSVSLQ